MKRYPKAQPASPANDNAPVRAAGEETAESLAPKKPVLHVYVRKVPDAPISEAVTATSAPIRKAARPPVFLTDFPEHLPILSEEVALMQGYLGDLVSQIIANDNDPT